jgi:sulfide:quinone oxidoreductase
VEAYNFFLSHRVWQWHLAHGRQSPIRSFTIVNANDRFVQYNDAGDTFFKEQLKKRNIKVEYGLKLVEVVKDRQEAVFEDVSSGARETRKYNNLYQILPSKPHEPLVNAGLTTPNGLLDVDYETLRHRKYKNIFGLGDVCDLPTTKHTWAAFHQLHVVRTNLERSLQG